jgi:peptidoglycan hydrolase-like protein with peptidoglycan-binding domain
MVDTWVQNSQIWLNSTYDSATGYTHVEPDGQTGWNTMYALTRALQIELNISPRSSTFGPTTLAQLASQVGNISAATAATKPRIVAILQCALWCKGYWGHTTFGQWDTSITSSITALRGAMGLDPYQTTVTPKMLKSLLTMDAYSLIGSGTSAVRSIQQWMNGKYLNRADFFILPCDGLYSRDVQRGLMYALQYEIGMADGTANGNLGPGTKSGLQTQAALSLGSTDGAKSFVHLFQAALTFNGFTAAFDGVYGEGTRGLARLFQRYVKLPDTGNADFPTWASLLISTGDTTRPGTAADCITTITSARAATLVGAGYQIIGRYLTNSPVANPLDKNIKPGELATIFANGLKVFPIFQEGGTNSGFFSYYHGRQAALRAHSAALGYGFKTGTCIYFAVDFDAYESEVHASIVPHFQGISETFAQLGNKYKVGIYGARNTCGIVSGQGYAERSFVGDMSTGFSGNLGYTLPNNWAFDQIVEYTIGSGSGAIGIDKDIASGFDTGQSSVDAPTTFPNYVEWLHDRALSYRIAHPDHPLSSARLTMQYLRHGQYHDPEWILPTGAIDNDWIAYVDSYAVTPVIGMLSPGSGNYINGDHLAASMHGHFNAGLNWNSSNPKLDIGDMCGWAGDLVQAANWWVMYKREHPGYTITVSQWALNYIGNSPAISTFSSSDFDEDMDAVNIARRLVGSDIDDVVRSYYGTTGAALHRYSLFFADRFFSDLTYARAVIDQAFMPSPVTDSGVWALWRGIGGQVFPLGVQAGEWDHAEFTQIGDAMLQVLQNKIASE